MRRIIKRSVASSISRHLAAVTKMIAVYYILLLGLATTAIANPTVQLVRNARDEVVGTDTTDTATDTVTDTATDTVTDTDATETTTITTVQTCSEEDAILGNASLYTPDSALEELLPRVSCGAWKSYTNNSGLFRISPSGGCEFKVFCDQCLHNQEGWIVIQRRVNDSVPFESKYWLDYKNGFGDYLGNYWMGLEKIHSITSSGNYHLFIGFKRVTLTTVHKRQAYYKGFSVASEAESYKMTYTEFDTEMSTTSYNSLEPHLNKAFTTRDHDNDEIVQNNGVNVNCADHSGFLFGGWWFGVEQNSDTIVHECFRSNLNGIYYPGYHDNGIVWTGEGYSMRATIMAIRKVD